jgi:hypothetical protein
VCYYLSMKRLIFVFMFFAIVLAGVAAQSPAAQNTASQPAVRISFNFTRLGGSASNQYAVWIEDAQGQHVKTLYATRYTANGGYKRRETSIPLWVKQSGLATMTSAQVDAVSGATPRTAALEYVWDGTNAGGTAVPNGSYTIVLEGTLRWGNQVYYRAPIALGQGASAAQVATQYVADPERPLADADRAMIGNVAVRVLR